MGVGSTLIFLDRSVQCDPRTFNRLLPLHVQLQLYYPSYFLVCVKQRPTKKSMLYKISATSQGTTQPVLIAFNNALIIASLPTCFISRLLNSSTSLAIGLL